MGLEALYLLIPASVVLAVVALVLFIWAIHSGQFDDLETPAIRILFEDGTLPDAAGSTAVRGAEPRDPNISAEPAIPAVNTEG